MAPLPSFVPDRRSSFAEAKSLSTHAQPRDCAPHPRIPRDLRSLEPMRRKHLRCSAGGTPQPSDSAASPINLMGYARKSRDSAVCSKGSASGRQRHQWLLRFAPHLLRTSDKPCRHLLDKIGVQPRCDLGKKPGDGRLELDYPTIALADIGRSADSQDRARIS